MKRLAALFLGASLLAAPGAIAVQPDEILQDPALERRARDISRHLRCLVCQNQSIDDSNAELARDLRVLVRERLIVGESDGEVMEFITARYGDYVLLKPPVKPSTYALWASPFILAILAFAAMFLYFYRRPDRKPAELTDDERRRLDILMSSDRTAPRE